MILICKVIHIFHKIIKVFADKYNGDHSWILAVCLRLAVPTNDGFPYIFKAPKEIDVLLKRLIMPISAVQAFQETKKVTTAGCALTMSSISTAFANKKKKKSDLTKPSGKAKAKPKATLKKERSTKDPDQKIQVVLQ